MTFGQAIRSCFSQYVSISGRATRSEFWYWQLFTILVGIATMILDGAFFPQLLVQAHTGPFHALESLVLFLPSLCVGVRRLHDVGHSGWWLLISLTGIGIFFPLLMWFCTVGQAGLNSFGYPTEQKAIPPVE